MQNILIVMFKIKVSKQNLKIFFMKNIKKTNSKVQKYDNNYF